MKQVFDTMTEATGVDFSEIMKAGTYDAKVNRNVTVHTPDLNAADLKQKDCSLQEAAQKLTNNADTKTGTQETPPEAQY